MKNILWLMSCLVVLPAVYAEPVTISAGEFRMGCSAEDKACDQDEASPGGVSVFVPAFKIDSHEVTVASYKECVAAGQCKEPITYHRSQYCNFAAPLRENHPVNCIDWEQAQQYCQWKGGRLPWEAEWEKAARAGTTTTYPWGKTVDCTHAILDDGKTSGSVANELDGCGEDRTWPVASRTANKFGLYDMHGNAGEWIGNGYAADAITTLYAKGNLSAPASSARKVVRGGSWDENINNLRSSFRNTKPPQQGDGIYGSIGFRCVYQK